MHRSGASRSSHEPGDGSGQEVLVTEPHAARHARVLLPEDLRHGLQLRAHLDEAVQLDSRALASQGEALHQRLGELGAEVVAHLGQRWESRGRRVSGIPALQVDEEETVEG